LSRRDKAMRTRDDSLSSRDEGSARGPNPTSDGDICKSCGKPFGTNASTNLFVSKLPPNWKQGDLRSNFESFGSTRSVKLLMDNYTSRGVLILRSISLDRLYILLILGS
ncbi:hypothetical protein Tco_0507450, partial [Tanacetum coccineum]